MTFKRPLLILVFVASACTKRRYTIGETPQPDSQASSRESIANVSLPEGEAELGLLIVNPGGLTWAEVESMETPIPAKPSAEFQVESALNLADEKKKRATTKDIRICYRISQAEFEDYILLGSNSEKSRNSTVIRLYPIPVDTCLNKELQSWFTAIAMKKSDWEGLLDRPNGPLLSSIPGSFEVKVPTSITVIADKATEKIGTRVITYDVDRVQDRHVVLKRSHVADWQ